MALDVAALLRGLGVCRHVSNPIHVIGYSLGAAVALQLAVLDADERTMPPPSRPLIHGMVLFGFTSSYLAGKSPVQRLCSDVLCSERFIRTLGVSRFGRLLATLMGYNWRAIDGGGGYPIASQEGEEEEEEKEEKSLESEI